MSDAEWHALNDEITAKGYEFQGNVMLPSDSDDGSCDCPMCGRTGYWAIWYANPDDYSQEAWANLCYGCGHMWVEYIQGETEE